MGEVSWGAAKPTSIELVGPKGVLYPGLSNLFEAVGVAPSPTHPIKIMRNDRMVCTWQHEKVHGHGSGIARGRAHTQADVSSVISVCFQVLDISRDDIGSWIKGLGSIPSSFPARGGIAGAVAQKQKQRKHEITQYVPEHCLNPPIGGPFKKL